MFMNRVHKQRPKIDSGTIPSRNGSKIGRVHRVHSLRPARATSPRVCRALPRACHTLPPSCLRASRALPCPSARPRAYCAPRLRAQLPAAPARAPKHACLRALRTPCVPSARPAIAPFLPQSRYSNCIVTQPPSQPTVSRYNAVL